MSLIVSRATAARGAGDSGLPGSPPSFQAQSAGKIRVAVPPGGVRAACTAAAASAPTLFESALVRTQVETARARLSVSAASGASYWR